MIKYSVRWDTVGNSDSLIIYNKCQLWTWCDFLWNAAKPHKFFIQFNWCMAFNIRHWAALSCNDSEPSLCAVQPLEAAIKLWERLAIAHYYSENYSQCKVCYVVDDVLKDSGILWRYCVACFFYFSGVAVYSVMISVLIFSNIVKRNEHFDVYHGSELCHSCTAFLLVRPVF